MPSAAVLNMETITSLENIPRAVEEPQTNANNAYVRATPAPQRHGVFTACATKFADQGSGELEINFILIRKTADNDTGECRGNSEGGGRKGG